MISKHLRSLGYAAAGIRLAWREEANFRIELACAALAVLLGLFVSLSTLEWLVVIGWCAVVLMAEAFNTALEELCDMLRATHDPHVGKIKDLAAAAVLLAATGALVSGLVIFVPRIVALLS